MMVKKIASKAVADRIENIKHISKNSKRVTRKESKKINEPSDSVEEPKNLPTKSTTTAISQNNNLMKESEANSFPEKHRQPEINAEFQNELPLAKRKKETKILKREANIHENINAFPETKAKMKKGLSKKHQQPEINAEFQNEVPLAKRKRGAVHEINEQGKVEERKAKPVQPSHKKEKISKWVDLKATDFSSLPTEGGLLHTFGTGEMGTLGFACAQRFYPAIVPSLAEKKVISAVCGGLHTIALTADGEVYTFGIPDDNCLGRNTDDEDPDVVEEKSTQPGIVDLPDKAIQVAAGDSHCVVLLSNGDVYGWGTFRNKNGKCGLIPGKKNYLKSMAKPVLLFPRSIASVVKIASGLCHVVLLTNEGMVYTFGSGQQGQLGRKLLNSDRMWTRGLKLEWGSKDAIDQALIDEQLTPTEIHTAVTASVRYTNVWTGSYSTYIKSGKDGSIYAFGLNNYDQLGCVSKRRTTILLPKKCPGFFKDVEWTHLAAGDFHCIALDAQGKVYTLGRKDDGRLGHGTPEDQRTLTRPTQVDALKGFKCVSISAGTSVSYAIVKSNDNKQYLYSWGFGQNKQLASGKKEEDVFVPTKCLEKKDGGFFEGAIWVSGGAQHSLVIKNISSDEKSGKDKERADKKIFTAVKLNKVK